MEQWAEDGRKVLWERWTEDKSRARKAVDEHVAKVASAKEAALKYHTCLSSALLSRQRCRVDEETQKRLSDTSTAAPEKETLLFRFDTDNEFAAGEDLSGFFGIIKRCVDDKHPLPPVLASEAKEATAPPTADVPAPAEKHSDPSFGIGTGDTARDRPRPKAECTVNYEWHFEGSMIERVANLTFVAGAGVVTQAMEEGVLSMCQGETAEILCDSAFAFKDNGFQPLDVRREESAKKADRMIDRMMGPAPSKKSKKKASGEKPAQGANTETGAEPADVAETLEKAAAVEESEKVSSDCAVALETATKPVVHRLIPPDATCTLRMTLVRIENALTAEERRSRVQAIRQRGSTAVSNKHWKEAFTLYNEAYELHIKPIPSEMRGGMPDVAAILLHNMALCVMEISAATEGNSGSCSREDASKAIQLCHRSVKADPSYAKARYRRALAHIVRQEWKEALAEADEMEKAKVGENSVWQSIRDQVAAGKKAADEALGKTCRKMFQ